MKKCEWIWIKLCVSGCINQCQVFQVKQLNLPKATVFNCKSGLLDLIQFIQPSFARLNPKIREKFDLTQLNTAV